MKENNSNNQKEKSTSTNLFDWKYLIPFYGVLMLAIVCGGDSKTSNGEKEAVNEDLGKLKISSCNCRRYKGEYGIGSYFACSVSIFNGSEKKFKNPEIKWIMMSKSGDELESESETIMDFLEPKKTLNYTKREITDGGMISDKLKQISKFRCELESADLVSEPLR